MDILKVLEGFFLQGSIGVLRVSKVCIRVCKGVSSRIDKGGLQWFSSFVGSSIKLRCVCLRCSRSLVFRSFLKGLMKVYTNSAKVCCCVLLLSLFYQGVHSAEPEQFWRLWRSHPAP